MLGLIELATHDDATWFVVVREFVVEMAVGTAWAWPAPRLLPLCGAALPAEGLYPVFALAPRAPLRRHVARTWLGLPRRLHRRALARRRAPALQGRDRALSRSLATLAEIVVFVGLGLTVSLGSLSVGVWFDAALLLLVLALIARPLVVALTLARARFRLDRASFRRLEWPQGSSPDPPCGLRRYRWRPRLGARLSDRLRRRAPLGRLSGDARTTHRRVYSGSRCMNVRCGPGGSRSDSARSRLRHRSSPLAQGSRAENERLSTLPLGKNAWVTLVVRDGAAVAPRGSLQLRAGDRVALLAEPEDRPASPVSSEPRLVRPCSRHAPLRRSGLREHSAISVTTVPDRCLSRV